MDRFENRILIMTGMLLCLFLFAVLYAMRDKANNVPACLPYDEAYATPKFVQLDDNTYQVYMLAQMWSFEPSEIRVPVGAEVDFYLSSKDVVHGFNVAKKNLNMMAVPGGINKTTIRFDEPGVYPIVCHEYCGSGHQHMRAEIIVNHPNN